MTRGADLRTPKAHSPRRNITFEVCYEYSAEEKGQQGLYELVAHLPEKSSSYLALGLSDLEQNT